MNLRGATLQCYGLSACILRKVYTMVASCARDGAQALSPTLSAEATGCAAVVLSTGRASSMKHCLDLHQC